MVLENVILTDGIHICSTQSVEELHAFAAKAGLRRCWFHGVRKGHPHYDRPQKVTIVSLLFAGAKRVSSRELIVQCYRRTTR